MANPFFKTKLTDLFFLLARTMPFNTSNSLDKVLSKIMVFMIHFQLVKK